MAKTIEALETEQTALHTKMAHADYFKSDLETQRIDQQRAGEIDERLLYLLERWETLEAKANGKSG